MTHDFDFSAVAFLVNDEGRICSVSRGQDLNDWGLPGGKAEKGETPEQTVVREVKEETNLEIFNLDKVMVQHDEGTPVHYFVADWNGDPRSSEEGRVAWLTWNELLQPHHTFYEFNARLFDVLHLRMEDSKT